MTTDYFEYINFEHPQLISEIKEYVAYSEKNNQFWISMMCQCRIDFPIDICRKIRDIMPFKITDYGCFKNVPGWVYPVHTDTKRTFAMNMLISQPDPGFEALFYSDDRSTSFPIAYIQNQWVLLNTKKLHSVRNTGSTNRYVISIGCETSSYQEIRELFGARGNIGKLQSFDHSVE